MVSLQREAVFAASDFDVTARDLEADKIRQIVAVVQRGIGDLRENFLLLDRIRRRRTDVDRLRRRRRSNRERSTIRSSSSAFNAGATVRGPAPMPCRFSKVPSVELISSA